MTIYDYDIIIIGSGISGLYSAYNIQKMSPNTTFMILERYKKQWIGGRMSNEIFYGTTVVTGAGVGRKDKDYLLISLLNELKIPYEEVVTKKLYASTVKNPVDVLKVIKFLRSEYKGYTIKPNVTFKEFARYKLGDKLYNDFIISAAYTDFENEDLYETLFEYGFNDNVGSVNELIIPWKQLIDTLYYKIGPEHVRTSTKVIGIEKINDDCNYIVNTEKGTQYRCKKIIVATTIPSVLNLVPGANKKDSIYQQIKGQTFLRMYGKFSKNSIPIMKKYIKSETIVPGHINKILPVDQDKGVYMIAYNDNKNAIYFKDHLKNTKENREFWCNEIEKALNISPGALQLNAIKDFYWPVATHYYEPLKGPYKNRDEFIDIAQHPEKGMLVVGELISRNQGWSQGALESVKKVVTKKWLNEKC
jgi:hypothetical protein